MNEIQKRRKRSMLFRLGNNYLIKNAATIRKGTKLGLSLTTIQRRAIRQLHWKIYLSAGSIGALAVLAVILPFHFTHLFDAQHFRLFGYSFEFELIYTIYGILMLLPEIWILNALNLYAVKELCRIYQYPAANQSDFEEQVALLTEAGLEMPSKHMQLLQVDPYIGLSKFSYYSLFILAKLKATLSNVVLKLVVKRILGRYALRIVTDLAGIPIYAFWNAWASRQVLKEAQMRIVATTTTTDFLSHFEAEELQRLSSELPLLIHFIAQQKRQYNFALYAFMKSLLDRVPALNLNVTHEVGWNEFISEDAEKNKLMGRLLVFGMIVDGSLSVKERLTLRKLDEEFWFPMPISEIDEILKVYAGGGGMKIF